jgi:HSP20 family protein
MNRLFRYTYPRQPYLDRSAFSGLENELGRLFDSAVADFASHARSPRFPVDLYADKDNTYIRAELPGIARDAIDLELAEGHLTIRTTRKQGEENVELSRTIALPDSVQADKVTAAYENGVLTVTVPKQEQAKSRKIDITVN